MPNATLTIAGREITEHVLSWRFGLALGLATLILATSVVALGAAHREDADAFETRQAQLEDDSASSSFAKIQLRLREVVARPNPLSILVGGPGDALRGEYDAGGAGPGGEGDAAPESGSGSPASRRFDPLDLGFVAAVVMTFMAVLFAYDAVSGERERGTLRLVLSNPVPKDAVLLGKYLGGMGSVLLAFLVATLVALAIVATLGIPLRGAEWARLGIVLGGVALLLSAFYLLGLLASSLSRRSATSLLVLSLAWLVLVFGVGNVAAVVAKGTSAATSGADLAEQFRAIDDRTFAELDSITEESFALREKQLNGGNLTEDETARLAQLETQMRTIFEEAETEREALVAAARRSLDSELARAEGIAAASPAEAFRTLATALAGSDYWSYRAAIDAAETYQREVERARAEWTEDKPDAGGRVAFIRGPGSAARQVGGFEDTFEPPAFAYEAPTISKALSTPSALAALASLLAWNVLGFLGAYTAFLRYDPR